MLNDEQKQAVMTTDGALRIIAGVGTGKTHTLISRIDYLIGEKGVDSAKILILTFTNKAANEIKERLTKMGRKNVLAMTFHALAARLLRKFWRDDFVIIDAKEQKEIIKGLLMKKEVLDLKNIILDFDFLREKRLMNEKKKDDFRKYVSTLDEKRLSEVLDKYEEILLGKGVLDFSGLLIALYKLWLLDEEILRKCQGLFEYVLVDEYQDVNKLQVEILKKLVEPHENICVVGDSDQTIYSWRGAFSGTLNDFEKEFFETKTIFLTKNYRNPPLILNGAESLIKNNPDRIEKKLTAVSSFENKISLWECKNEMHRFEVLGHLLEKYLGSISGMHEADELDGEGNFRQMSDIAILYRTQSEGKVLAEYLSKKSYPYQISNGEYFWKRKEIKNFIEDLEKLNDLSGFAQKKFSEWMSDAISAYSEVRKLSAVRGKRLQHLITYSLQFDDLDLTVALKAFLDEVKTMTAADNLVYGDRINLLTLHSAKGLEFPVVMIFGLEEGNIPHKKFLDDDYFLAEERRLFYVGMTRAKEDLHLFYTSNIDEKESKRSRFLGEIGVDNLFFERLPEKGAEKLRKKELKKAQMSLF